MLAIGIIGATGMAGSAIYKLAVKKGYDVTAIVRNKQKARDLLGEDAQLLVKDAFDLTKNDLKVFDILIDAVATPPQEAENHVNLAQYLTSLFGVHDCPRLIFILGAGSLMTGDDNHLFVDDIAKLPDSDKWISIPQQQICELEFLKGLRDVNWTGVSPAINFVAGPVAKKIIYGKDYLLFNEEGKSITTSGTMAEAILREIAEPKHLNERFTVANG